jgi:NRPS condensation-like uncharacterized protein
VSEHDKAPQEVSFRRQLKGIERYFFRCPNANLVTVSRIKGTISAKQLSSALLRLRRKHPLLGVRISLDDSNTAWFTAQGVPQNSIDVKTKTNNPDGWLKAASNEQQVRFPLDKGPLIRFVLCNSAKSSDLIINAHHSICDGLSITYLIRDILFAIANPQWEPELRLDPPIIEKTDLPPSFPFNPHQRIFIYILNKLWRRKKISFDEADYETLHRKYWSEQTNNRTLTWGLTKSQTSAFINRCREEHVTINNAILTALMAAQHDIQGAHPAYLHTVSMPVNIRNRLSRPIGEAFGLYVSSVSATLNYALRTSFWSNVREIQDRMKKRLTNRAVFLLHWQMDFLHPSLIDSIYFSKYGLLNNRVASFFLRLIGIRRVNTGLDISNFGRYDFPVSYGALELKAIIVPAFLSDYQEKCLRIITVGGKMFFTFTFRESILDLLTAEQIRDTSMKYLSQARAW